MKNMTPKNLALYEYSKGRLMLNPTLGYSAVAYFVLLGTRRLTQHTDMHPKREYVVMQLFL